MASPPTQKTSLPLYSPSCLLLFREKVLLLRKLCAGLLLVRFSCEGRCTQWGKNGAEWKFGQLENTSVCGHTCVCLQVPLGVLSNVFLPTFVSLLSCKPSTLKLLFLNEVASRRINYGSNSEAQDNMPSSFRD